LHTQSALYPIIDLLERFLRLAPKDPPDRKLDTLENTLRQHHLNLEETVPFLAALLSIPLPADRYPPLILSPEMQKKQSFKAVLTLLFTLSSQQPVLFIVEDIHWIDPSTLELLTLLVEQRTPARLYTLFTYRPVFVPPWTSSLGLTQITLIHLSPDQARLMIHSLANDKALPAEVIQQIVMTTDGVPLFIEEMTRMILESGQLKDRGDRYELIGSLASLALPTTLQGSMMARLDRLGEGKAIAQMGATIGREFLYDLLHAISNLDEAMLNAELKRLVDVQLLYQQGVHPKTIYTFKHALIQDIAYQSLQKSDQNLYHQRISNVMIERFPEIVENQPELLAQHFFEADMPSKAVDWWLRAGHHAIQQSANTEAIGHLEMALRLLANLPDSPENRHRELVAQMSLGPALCATRGYAAVEVERAFGRAYALCQGMSDGLRLFSIQWGLWAFYVVRAELHRAGETAQTMMRAAEAKGDPNLLLEAHFCVGLTHYFLGQPVAAIVHLRKGIALDLPERDRAFTFQSGQDAGVCGLTYAGLTLWQLGHLDEALEMSRKAIDLARRIQHPFSLAYALNFAGWLCQMCRNVEEAKAYSEEEIGLSKKQGFFWVSLGSVIYGWAVAKQGQVDAGLTSIDQGLGAYRGAGARLSQTYQLAIQAEALLRANRAEEGLRLVDEALASMEETGERFWEGELHRLRGLLFLALPSSRRDEALMSLRKAVEIARRQQAPMGILRAAIDLARMAAHSDEKDEARALLAETLSVFPPTKADFPDLCEAKALFADLTTGAS
jgi:predicted ATPase